MYELKIALLGILTTTTLFGASVFEKIGQSFDQSEAPVLSEVKGYWSGRCVDKNSPDKLMPAIFVQKTMKVPGDFPPTRQTMSYFYDATAPENAFDKMSPNQIENHAGVSRWFQKEQWNKISEVNGSLENDYIASDRLTIHRALRSYVTQFDKTLLLQVSRIDRDLGIDTNIYCFFDSFRGQEGSSKPVTTPLLAETGPVANQYVYLVNDQPYRFLSSYEIANLGATPIQISNIQWTTASGVPVIDNNRYILRAGQVISFYLRGSPSFQLRDLRFFVSGATSRIRISGTPAI